MPNVRSASLFDKAHCPFGQALDYVIHRDIAKVREAPPPLSQRQWTPETYEACRSLCWALEGRAVRSIDDPDAVHLVRWSNVQQALDDLLACPDASRFARFIAIIERVTRAVRVRVDDLVKTFPAPVPAPEPAPVRRPSKSEMVAFCRSLTSVKQNRKEMDEALKLEFGYLPPELCRDICVKAGFKPPRGRRPTSK
jgi:hypothetical protein